LEPKLERISTQRAQRGTEFGKRNREMQPALVWECNSAPVFSKVYSANSVSSVVNRL
jgi:hypothetical protein